VGGKESGKESRIVSGKESSKQGAARNCDRERERGASCKYIDIYIYIERERGVVSRVLLETVTARTTGDSACAEGCVVFLYFI
jgi:hypothetical protein